MMTKAQAVLSEPELLQAMFDVGYFPPNTTPTVAPDYDLMKWIPNLNTGNIPQDYDDQYGGPRTASRA
jgi:hypothetical protein